MAKKKPTYEKLILKTRDEWLQKRGIGGSDLAIIMGEGKWGTTDDLYNRLALGIYEKDQSKNERIAEGVATEDSIRTLFKYDLGDEYSVIAPPKRGSWLFRSIAKPYMTVTPDGLLKRNSDRKLGGLEIKNVELRKRADKDIWERNSLPDQYFWQIIQYFVVKDDIEFVVLFAHLKYFSQVGGIWVFDHAEDRPYFISRKSVHPYIVLATKKEEEFYEGAIKARKRPATIKKF